MQPILKLVILTFLANVLLHCYLFCSEYISAALAVNKVVAEYSSWYTHHLQKTNITMTTMFPSSAITEIPARWAIVRLAHQRQTPGGGGAEYQSHAQETKGGDLCPIFAYCVHPIVQKMGRLWAACYKQSHYICPSLLMKDQSEKEGSSFFILNPRLFTQSIVINHKPNK